MIDDINEAIEKLTRCVDRLHRIRGMDANSVPSIEERSMRDLYELERAVGGIGRRIEERAIELERERFARHQRVFEERLRAKGPTKTVTRKRPARRKGVKR